MDDEYNKLVTINGIRGHAPRALAKGYGVDEVGPYKAIAMEYVEDDTNSFEGLLHYTRIKRLLSGLGSQGIDFKNVIRIGLAIAETLEMLHMQGIYHADLNPANIIVQIDASALGNKEKSTTVKKAVLIDFGNSAERDQAVTPAPQAHLALPPYGAPERFDLYWDENGKLVHGPFSQWRYTPGVDVYSLGCILYYLYTGHEPVFDRSVDVNDESLSWRERAMLPKRIGLRLPRRPGLSEYEEMLENRLDLIVQLCTIYDPKKRAELSSLGFIRQYLESVLYTLEHDDPTIEQEYAHNTNNTHSDVSTVTPAVNAQYATGPNVESRGQAMGSNVDLTAYELGQSYLEQAANLPSYLSPNALYHEAYKVFSAHYESDPRCLKGIAYMMENGLGMTKDKSRARKLYARVAYAGDKESVEVVAWPDNALLHLIGKMLYAFATFMPLLLNMCLLAGNLADMLFGNSLPFASTILTLLTLEKLCVWSGVACVLILLDTILMPSGYFRYQSLGKRVAFFDGMACLNTLVVLLTFEFEISFLFWPLVIILDIVWGILYLSIDDAL